LFFGEERIFINIVFGKKRTFINIILQKRILENTLETHWKKHCVWQVFGAQKKIIGVFISGPSTLV